MAGSDATAVAIGFAIYAQTQSAQWISFSMMATIGAGVLVSPFAGRLGDMVDRRRLMITAELVAAAIFIALALVHTPVALVSLGVLATIVGTIFGPASAAAIAHVAGEQHLTWANSVIATGANVGKTAGRLVAGALISVLGAASVFLLDAVTFLVSAWLIASVRRGFSGQLTGPPPGEDGPPAPSGPERRRENKAGLRFLLRDRTLRPVVAASAISTFATAFTMTAEVPLVFELGVGAVGLGALTACWGAGMVLGSWYAGRALDRSNEITGLLAGRVTMALGVGLVATAPSLTPMLACYLLGGLGGGFMGVAAQSVILRNSPVDQRARTLGAIEACRNAALGLGVVGAGAMVEFLGARPVYAIVGTLMAVGCVPIALLLMQMGGPRRLRPALAAA
jgi:MFS family permease